MSNKILDYVRYGKMNNNIVSSDYIEFRECAAAEDWGKKYYDKWSKQYKQNMQIANKVIKTPCIDASVECYCGYNYKEINDYLRFGLEKDNLYKEMSDVLAITLTMAPRVPNNIIVYRLVCDEFINELIKNNKKGIPTQEKGFISTSLTKDIINSQEYYSEQKNMLKIYVQANTVGIYVNGVTKRHENELLLYPDGYFRLLKKPYEENNKKIYECLLFYMWV